MKHIRIVLSLLIVVVISMVGIFAVEGITTPIIEARLNAEAYAALYEMFGEDPENTSVTIEEVTADYPEDAYVQKVYLLTDGSTQLGVVYNAIAPGYNPGINFLLGVNLETNQLAGFSVLAETETAGLGKDLLADPAFSAQFVGKEVAETRDNGVDLTSGSTARMTLGGVNNGIKQVLIYHGVNFLGEEAPVIETPEEMILRLKGEWFPGATFTDVYGNYEETPIITEVVEASTGGYFMTAIYVGFEQSQASTFVIGVNDGNVVGFASIETFETTGIGQTLVEHPDFAAQFVDQPADVIADGVDFVAGSTASYTLDGINESIGEVMDFYLKQIVGVVDEEAPVLVVNEARPTTFEVGSEAPNWDLYVTGTDNEDEVVVVTNNAEVVDFNVAGTYTVTFNAVDAAGNAATPVEVVIEITDAPVEFVLIPVPAEIQTVLEGMDLSTTDFHDEGITDGLIQGIYTGRDAEGNILSVFYNVSSNNGNWAPDNSIMVQFAPGSTSIVAVNVFDKNATYYTNDFAPNYNVGEDFDSPIIAAAWAGVNGVGQVTQTDLDTVSGTTAEESFPSMIESIEAVLQYQIDNSIGGAE